MNHIMKREEKVNLVVDISIKLALLAIVIYISYLIAKPFLGIIMGGVIIAVSLSPTIGKLEQTFRNRKMVIITFMMMILAGLIFLTYLFSDYAVDSAFTLKRAVKDGTISIPLPTENVKEWPFIGNKVYTFWQSISVDFRETLTPYSDEIRKVAKFLLLALTKGFATIFLFMGSIIIATVFLIYQEKAVTFYHNILRRLVGERSQEWASLSASTVRSVTVGVLGVAVFEALLSLVGLLVMDVPFAIVWAAIIFFLTMIQVSTMIVVVPIIAYVLFQNIGVPEIIFSLYFFLVGMSNSVLRAMLIGRGVNIPTIVILIGAIGGMILMGFLGLFLGAVIFTLFYKLFDLWINETQSDAGTEKAT